MTPPPPLLFFFFFSSPRLASPLQDGYTPLHCASYNGHVDALQALLEAGANPEATNNVSTHTHPMR